MVFSRDDRILIRELRECKGYGAKRLLKEFPLKNWSLAGLKRLLKGTAVTGSSELKLETLAFISPTLWPPNCPDLSPAGYKI